MHRQRIWILVGIAVVFAGYLTPWAGLGKESYNAFDHAMFRVPLIAFVVGMLPLPLFGARKTRVTGPAAGTIVVLALLIAAITLLLTWALVKSSNMLAWKLGYGMLVTLVGCVLLIVTTLMVGKNDLPDLDTKI